LWVGEFAGECSSYEAAGRSRPPVFRGLPLLRYSAGRGSTVTITSETVIGQNSPLADAVKDRASARYLFGLALFLATTIPFIAAAFKYAFPNFVAISVQQVVMFLAGIHVPLTAYLFFDPKIRKYMVQRPIALIGGPILIFGICFLVFFSTWKSRETGHAWPAVYFMLAVLTWNFWHFGKQNIGVYSFFRISQSLSAAAPVERNLILFGSALGTLAIFHVAGAGYIKLYAHNETFPVLSTIYGYVGSSAKILQYALLAFVIGYASFNWQRFTWKSAVVFLLCANFFFPQFLTMDKPDWAVVFACSSLSHGAQYCVFLGSHAAQYQKDQTGAGMPPPSSRIGSIVMCAIIVVMAAFLGEVLLYNTFIPKDYFSTLAAKAFGRGDMVAAVVDSVMIGILLTHFWLDSFFWRFKKPEPRQWMLNRYAFLFNSRKQ
jgi:hypothetical protein